MESAAAPITPVADSRATEIETLRRENAALRAEIDRLNASLRMRAASLFAEAGASPRALAALPGRAWALFREFEAARAWRRLALALECGLPNDPLRVLTPSTSARDSVRRLTARAFTPEPGGTPPLADDDDGPLARAARRLVELERLAEDGASVPPAATRRKAADARRVMMFLHAGEPDVVNGYTRRSQELIAALTGDGWTIDARLRRIPDDAIDVAPVSEARIIGDAEYRRLAAVCPKDDGLDAYVDAYAAAMGAVIDEAEPALIHAASNHVTGRAALIAARRAGLPFVYEVRGLWEVTRASVEPIFESAVGFRAQRRIEIDVARAADRLLVNGGALRDYFVDAGVEPARIAVVHNGCDPAAFDDAAAEAPRLRKAWGLDARPVIGFVGSLTAYEGVEDILRAAAQLPVGAAQFLIVGEGPSRPELEAAARSLGVADRARFVGRVSPHEAQAAYALIDVAPLVRRDMAVTRLVPPLKPLDAMAAHAALVVSDLPPLVEFADAGRGRITPPSDPRALAATLAALLGDHDARARQCRAARAWVEAERLWRHSASAIAEAYGAALRVD